MRDWTESIERLISNNHLFVIDLLNFINLIPNINENDKLNSFLQNVNELRASASENDLRLLKVISGTNLKHHIIDLKGEGIDYFEKYIRVTTNYKKMIDGDYTDTYSYSEKVVASFNYFYNSLILGKRFNEHYGILNNKLSDLISIEEFRREWSLYSACPYCDITQLEFDSTSIDHFFPKQKFPLLSIYPNNLVVSCTACNDRLKKDELNIPCAHPYFDNIEDYFSFFIQPDKTISLVIKPELSIKKRKKIENYLSLFKIESRYNTNGKYIIEELEKSIRKNLVKELKYSKFLTHSIIAAAVDKELSDQLENLKEIRMSRSFIKLQIDYIDQLTNNKEYKDELVEYLKQMYCSL